jgi:hypothetical protein
MKTQMDVKGSSAIRCHEALEKFSDVSEEHTTANSWHKIQKVLHFSTTPVNI